jgi:hypothetical protein
MKSRIVPRTLPHRPPTLRVGKTRRRVLYLLVLLLVSTGAWWLVLNDKTTAEGLPDPALHWLMKVHGGGAMLALFLAGTFLHNHVLNAWQQGRNRMLGSLVGGSMVLIGVSGYGLYYFDGDLLRNMAEWLHWVAGFGLPALLWWHIARGRRHRSERKKALNFPLRAEQEDK